MAKNAQSDLRITDKFDSEVFWSAHGKKIGIAVVTLAALGGVVLLRQRQASGRAEREAISLNMANDPNSLEQVIQSSPNSPTALQAMLRLAELHYQNSKYSDAASAYERVLNQFPNHPLAMCAKLGLATVFEAQGKWEQARAQYILIIRGGPDNYAVNAAKVGLARCFQATGQPKEARQQLEEVMAAGQGSPRFVEAYLQAAVIGRDVPQDAPIQPSAQSTALPSLTSPNVFPPPQSPKP